MSGEPDGSFVRCAVSVKKKEPTASEKGDDIYESYDSEYQDSSMSSDVDDRHKASNKLKAINADEGDSDDDEKARL